MSKSKDLIKRHSESVTHNTLGNLITAAVLYGGAGVVGLLTSYSALLAALPLYAVLPLGAGVFLIIAAAFYLLAGARGKLQAAQQKLQAGMQDESSDESSTALIESEVAKVREALNTQHQSDIKALREQVDELAFSRDQQADEIEGRSRAFKDLKSKHDVLKERLDAWERHAWLVSIADAQAKNINEYVRVEGVFLCPLRLTDPIQIPYVEFWLDIINTSVYDITVHKNSIEGNITFQLNKLLEGKEIIFPYESIPPSRRMNVNIRQRLKPTEVSLLAPYENKREEALSLFNLNDLVITISGGTRFPQVERKYLTIPQITGSQDTEQLKAEPTIKIEILEATYRGYVSHNEGILGTIANLNVRLTNLRRTRINVKSFRLRIMLHGTTYISDAAQGETYEGRFKDKEGEIRPTGQRLQNLNFNSEFPIGIEPEQPVGGRLQFSVDGQFASDADSKPSATLTIVDTLGNEHNENCRLTFHSVKMPHS